MELLPFSVAYLGFQKGGAKFSLATSAHTKGGGQTKFSNFFSMSKKIFFGQRGGAMAQWPPPPKYASDLSICIQKINYGDMAYIGSYLVYFIIWIFIFSANDLGLLEFDG